MNKQRMYALMLFLFFFTFLRIYYATINYYATLRFPIVITEQRLDRTLHVRL
jgi:hypothetical protein